MDNKQQLNGVELTDQHLEEVVGGFTIGETRCTVCGLRTHCVGTYEGKDGARLALVTLPCGHQTYIPERALTVSE